MSFQTDKLGEHVEILSGFAFKSSDFNTVGEGLPLVRIRDVVPGKSSTYYSGKYPAEYLLSDGDLLIGMDGDFNRENWRGGRALLNQRVCRITAKQETLDQGYLYHFLPKALIKIHSETPAVTVKHLSVKGIKNIDIPLPPLAEQKRIAAILDKADNLRRKRQQAIQLADDFLRSVFLDMFGDPVTNPKGWKKEPITELADVITGFAFKSNEYVGDSTEAVRLCRGANTLTGYFDWSDTVYWPEGKLEKLDGYLINEGDVILAMDRPWISSGLKVCIFPESQRRTYLVQRVARLRPKDPILSDYIYSCIKSKAFERHCCPTETTVPHISPVELKSFEVLIPETNLLQKYHSVVSVLGVNLKKMIDGNQGNEAFFHSLSQKAFAGEL